MRRTLSTHFCIYCVKIKPNKIHVLEFEMSVKKYLYAKVSFVLLWSLGVGIATQYVCCLVSV